MTREAQATFMIDVLMDIRHAKHSQDPRKTLENQEKVIIAKLETLGVTVSDLPEDC